MKVFLLMVIIFSLFCFSCDLFDFSGIEFSNNFWAIDFTPGSSNSRYRVYAQSYAQGKFCNVWVENGAGVTKAQAQEIADKYDYDIRQKMIDAFSIKNINYNGSVYDNSIVFADMMGDRDGKLCILLLDLKDSYIAGKNESYTAGYFWSGDFQSANKSNQRDIIFIDTNPGMKGKTPINDACLTLAHETQHMMNFANTYATRDAVMDTWIDEGLSSAAEWMVSGGHLKDRLEWYNENEERGGLISQGNNFFVWGNHDGDGEGKSRYAVLDDYATVYLFFQWLRLQAGSVEIYSSIASSVKSDYRAVVESMSFSGWEELIKTWHAANYINAGNGPYGYMNDRLLININTPVPPRINGTVTLAPGEGVYSFIQKGFSPASDSGRNIRYVSLLKSVPSVENTFNDGRVLLTYNANDSRNGSAEKGSTTGILIPAEIGAKTARTAGRSASPESRGPYRVGAGDLTGRQNFAAAENDYNE